MLSFSRTAIPAALLALAVPGAASAATFHVAPAASGSCTPSHTCGSIQDAILAARATPEADVVDVAAGAYTQKFSLQDTTDQGVVVQGAGSGTDPAKATIVTAPDTTEPTVVAATSSDDAAITVRGMRLRQPAGGTSTVSVNGGVTLEDVAVEGPPSGSAAVHAEDGTVTLRRVTLTSSGVQPLDAELAHATISDSRFTVTAGTSFAAVVGGGTIVRSIFDGGPSGSGLDVIGNASVDSSLVVGGTYGVRVENADAELTLLQNVTVDVGAPGTADGGSMVAVDHRGAGELQIDSSILRERVAFTGGGTLQCAYDDVGTPSTNETACRTGAGENTSTSAAQLFADAAHGDWRLRADSPARDRGREGGLAVEESPLDLAGLPRIAKDDCYDVVRRDQGAYELPVVCPPPTEGTGTGDGGGSGSGAGSGSGSGGGASGSGGGTGTGGGTVVVVNQAPVLHKLQLRRAGRRLQARVQVSEAAAVRFVLQRKAGRRWKTVKRAATTIRKAGTVTLRLPIARAPRGTLRLTAQATDGQGGRSRLAISRTLRVR